MTGNQELEQCRESAARWHDRLQDGAHSDEVQRAFAQWLAHSPQHPAAYDKIDRAWQSLRAGAQHPSVLALRRETTLRHTPQRAARSGRRAALAAAVIMAITAAGILTLRAPGTSPFAAWVHRGSEQVYDTGVGQRRPVLLADGSRVTLDTQSELHVAFGHRERVVRLTRGQALFEVAKDHDRPFVVSAGSRRFVAVGTAFDVRVAPEQVTVIMVEGTVRVESTANLRASAAPASSAPSPAPLPVLTITAGDQYVFDERHVDRVSNADPIQATSWLRGQIIFENATLAAATEELNRYSAIQITLGDSTLAAMHISGTFTANRPDLFVEALTHYYPIDAVIRNRKSTVLMPR